MSEPPALRASDADREHAVALLREHAAAGRLTGRRASEPPRPGTPLVRVFAISVFAGIDVWRVPIEWAQRTWREVIRGIRSAAHKELEAGDA